MTTISMKISTGLERRLRNLAEKRGITRSALIREAVERLVEETGARSDSCLAVASDLIGRAEGPSDLSYNKKRMRGFGK